MEPLLQALLDREAIRMCIVRLARGEDRRDATLIRSSWWPEARFDYGVHSGDFAAYLAWVVPGAEAIRNTQHILGQTHIVLDGDRARAETHVISYHRIATGEAGERDTCIGGRYLDVLERRSEAAGGAEWRIADRVMLYDWEQDWGAAANWAEGVMGYPFSAEHFPGRAQGDYSETFFAGGAA